MKTDQCKKWMMKLFGLGSILIFLTGCLGPLQQRQPLSTLEKDFKTDSLKPSPAMEEGSLWSASVSRDLFSDVKARNVGDVVTISIVESAKASKNAATKTARDSGLEASWSGMFDAVAGNWSINGQKIGTSHKIDLANNFDGKGETTRESHMTAYITARVVHVLPNGNLVIQGTRQVQVNNESQYIFIQGVVRPEDISFTNIVLSTYIAQAVIELSGKGAVSDKQSPGWLARIVDWAWPF